MGRTADRLAIGRSRVTASTRRAYCGVKCACALALPCIRTVEARGPHCRGKGPDGMQRQLTVLATVWYVERAFIRTDHAQSAGVTFTSGIGKRWRAPSRRRHTGACAGATRAYARQGRARGGQSVQPWMPASRSVGRRQKREHRRMRV